MAIEAWAVLGATAALALAVVIQTVALFRAGRAGLSVWLRAAAAVALVAALPLTIANQDRWLPSAPRLVALGLSLAALLTALLLRLPAQRRNAYPNGLDLASLPVDLFALVLNLLAVLWMSPGGPLPECAQESLAFGAQWSLLLAGSGAAIVAAGGALALALTALLTRLARIEGDRPLPRRLDLHGILQDATALTLLLLGSGLVLGAWWSWRSTGRLLGNDPQIGWLAVAWLIAAMSRQTWRLGGRPARWAAGLSIAAALVAGASWFVL